MSRTIRFFTEKELVHLNASIVSNKKMRTESVRLAKAFKRKPIAVYQKLLAMKKQNGIPTKNRKFVASNNAIQLPQLDKLTLPVLFAELTANSITVYFK